jgi:hypothetical protein
MSARPASAPAHSTTPAVASRALHSLRALGTRWFEPAAAGSSRQAFTAASAPPRAANQALAGASAPSRLLSSPVPGPLQSSSKRSCQLLLGLAPRLVGHACEEVVTGLLSPVSPLKPSSGAARPLGGPLAAESSEWSRAAAPQSALTAAATSALRQEAAAAVDQASCGGPPSPSRALTA